MNNQKLMGLLVGLALMVLILVAHLWQESRPGTPEILLPYGDPAPDPAAGNAAPASSDADALPQAPLHALSPPPEPGGIGTLLVHLRNHGFKPVNFAVRATSTPLNVPLSQSRPQSVSAEPSYDGEQIWYGVLRLGAPSRNFAFALDLTPDQRFHMWFDANANGDLGDDAGPLKNQGSGSGGPGGFATVLRVPWEILDPRSGFEGDFEIWFFSNKRGWEKGRRASHYSRTQLRGEAMVADRRYLAWVTDSGYNDANLTNDGLLVDLNGNGKADRNEWFADASADEKLAAGARGRAVVGW